MNLPNDRIWISLAAIHAIHEDQVGEHGGRIGVRDPGLLESALARPQQYDAYAESKADIRTLAAIYGIAFIRNHPFIDGNKRVGLVVLEVFLRLNSFQLRANNAMCVVEILALAAGERTDEQFTEWVRQHATR